MLAVEVGREVFTTAKEVTPTMDGAVTWQVLGLLMTTVGGALGLWWRIDSAIKQVRDETDKKLEIVRAEADKNTEMRATEIIVLQKALMDYKVHAAERFATFDNLKDVEVRLTTALDRLTNRVEALPRQFADELRGFNAREG